MMDLTIPECDVHIKATSSFTRAHVLAALEAETRKPPSPERTLNIEMLKRELERLTTS